MTSALVSFDRYQFSQKVASHCPARIMTAQALEKATTIAVTHAARLKGVVVQTSFNSKRRITVTEK